jgi:hypothetical protein
MRKGLRLTLWLLTAVIFGALLSGCAGSPHGQSVTLTTPSGTTVTKSLTTVCPTGRSYMGCASGATAAVKNTVPLGRFTVTRPVKGCVFPDVSSYQGTPNWALAQADICAAVDKAGEYVEDPTFASNVAAERALKIPWAAYWFVRSCDDGARFVSVLNSVGYDHDSDALRPVLDMEVPAARGCAVPMADAIHKAFGVYPVIYTAPGTWPGGSSGGLDVWEASYGAELDKLPFAAKVLAWQRYSPPYTYYYLPGISNGKGGYGDVSIDLAGFSKDLAFPPAPKPTKPAGLPHTFKYYDTFVDHVFAVGGGRRLNERLTVEAFERRPSAALRADLRLLARRIYLAAHLSPKRTEWGLYHRGLRYHLLGADIHSTK